MYCEWDGGQYLIKEFVLSHATHRFKMDYDSVDKYWDCSMDNVVKYSYPLSSANFSGGPTIIARGESHQEHAQIGRNAPGKLAFTDLQYQKQSDGSWPLFNVMLVSPDNPYGNDEPLSGQMRAWTNPH